MTPPAICGMEYWPVRRFMVDHEEVPVTGSVCEADPERSRRKTGCSHGETARPAI